MTATREGVLIDATHDGEWLMRKFENVRRVVKATLKQLTPYDYAEQKAFLIRWPDIAERVKINKEAKRPAQEPYEDDKEYNVKYGVRHA